MPPLAALLVFLDPCMRHNALNGKIVPKLYRNQAYDKQTFEKTAVRELKNPRNPFEKR
jgi:hypothetical protein